MQNVTLRLLSLFALLAGCFSQGFVLSAGAQAPSAAKRLESVLRADGTLAVPAGTAASFDATGFRLVAGPDGAPRFVAAADTRAEGDEQWDDRFGLPGVLYGPVHALAVDAAGDLYVGGYFFSAGGLQASNVARWDGRRWHALGTGVDGQVLAIATAGTDVYVGGEFQKAGDVIANSVARWDGTRWHALGMGVQSSFGGNGRVNALAFTGGRLYAGGSFEKAGGVDARSLALWNGTGWSEAGGGIYYAIYSPTSHSVGTVYTLLPVGDDLYVGGTFAFAGQTPAKSIARLNTTTGAWTAFGEGLWVSDFSLGSVYAIAVRGDALYAAGEFVKAGALDVNNVARWDLAAGGWSALGQGLQHTFSPRVRDLAFVGATLYAVGGFTFAGGATANSLAKWENGAWAPVTANGANGFGASTDVNVLLPDGAGLYVGGDFDTVAGLGVNNVARLDPAGGTWSTLGEGINSGTCCGYVNAVAVAPDGDVYAGGYFEYAGSVIAHSIARWDGTRWHALGQGLRSGSSNGAVHAIEIVGDDVFVGGDFTSAGGRAATYVARWDAATETWHALGSGVNGYVFALAYADGVLYAGGDFSAAGAVTADAVAQWDGTAWAPLGGGVDFGSGNVRALAVGGDLLFVGGDFSRFKPADLATFVDVEAFVFWDRVNDEWYSPGDGGVFTRGSFGDYAGDVEEIAVAGTDVYVAGDFDRAGTVAAHRIARFNLETGWSALGSNVGGQSPEVAALAVHGTDLYVGGLFETAGGLTVNNIAKWDGTAWTALGSGILSDAFSAVNDLAIRENELYAGGDFVGAGGTSAHNFAHWTIEGGDPGGASSIAVDPLALGFGDVTVGAPEVRMVTVTNEANATADLVGAVGAATGPFRVVEGGGAFRLAPGQSRQVIVQFDPAAAGPATGTLPISHNTPGWTSPMEVALSGTGIATQTGPAVLRAFDPDGPQAVWTDQNGNLIFGTNAYGDRAKAVALTPPAGKQSAAFTVRQVDVWFGYKTAGPTDATYTLRLYAGTAATGPTGPALHSQTFRVADIDADADVQTPEDATAHVLTQPMTIDGPFFVSVDFGPYTEQQLAAVAAGAWVDQRVPEVWEQWSDGTWHNLSDAWTGDEGAPGTGTAGASLWIAARNTVSTDASPAPELPATLALEANYPNPFNPSTRIRYTLDAARDVRLRVYDVRGRLVQTLVDGVQPAGTYDVAFDAAALPSGTYFYRLETPQQTLTRPMVLLR